MGRAEDGMDIRCSVSLGRVGALRSVTTALYYDAELMQSWHRILRQHTAAWTASQGSHSVGHPLDMRSDCANIEVHCQARQENSLCAMSGRSKE